MVLNYQRTVLVCPICSQDSQAMEELILGEKSKKLCLNCCEKVVLGLNKKDKKIPFEQRQKLFELRSKYLAYKGMTTSEISDKINFEKILVNESEGKHIKFRSSCFFCGSKSGLDIWVHPRILRTIPSWDDGSKYGVVVCKACKQKDLTM